MTNKKIDIWLRFLLYFAPFAIWTIFCGLYIRGVADGTGGLWVNQASWVGIVKQLRDVLIYTIRSGSPFASLHSWVQSNITGTSNLGEVCFLYCYHLIFIEIAILFKNVFLFVIRVANELIERGATLGK